MARRGLKDEALVSAAVADDGADRMLASHHRAILALQDRLRPIVVPNVVLPNNVEVLVTHRKGTAPAWVGASAIRHAAGAITGGVISQYLTRSPTTNLAIDATTAVVLVATGFGMPITIDVLVF